MAEPNPVLLTHQLDQLGATVRQVAPIFAIYFTTLTANGVDSQSALYLTSQLQRQLIPSVGSSHG